MTPTSDTHMTADGQPSDTAIERFIVGDCAGAEAAEIEKWVRSGGEDAAVIRWLRGRLEEPLLDVSVKNAADLAIVKSVFAQRIDNSQRPSKKRFGGRLSYVSLRGWVGYTAAAVTISVVGFVAVQQLGWPFRTSGGAQREFTTYTTAPGKRAKIDLPDGSTVSLSVASSVRYARNFGKGTRDIYLEGEAYFEVPRSASSPFTVHTGNTVTRVLGTSFGVRKYQDENAVRVLVNAGKVQVKNPSAERVVTSGESVNAVAGGINTIPLNPSSTAWMRGEMVFVKAPLADVARELERWYGLNVQLDDMSLGDELVTATLGSQTSQDAVRIVTMMFGGRAVQKGNTITIYRR